MSAFAKQSRAGKMRHSLVSLALGMVAAFPFPYGSYEFSLLSPSRALAYDAQFAQMLFAGAGYAHNSRVMLPPGNLRTADSFRRDTETVWAESISSTWSVLPPQLLGAARQARANSYCESCISAQAIMMTGQMDVPQPTAY
ncbi:hypothetical protein [Aureimonas leprariae]|uniref:hypothetical protein n=1 Tax=Plantimonas leprariae TaxID=2615207 RepID=UPI001386E252|nr:hypothetical protein [Aureimonas leprariae]